MAAEFKKHEGVGPSTGGFKKQKDLIGDELTSWSYSTPRGMTLGLPGQAIYIKPARLGLNNAMTDSVVFDPFVTSFTDEYSTNWTATDVYGRMDPIYVYQNTQRVINISFNAIANDPSDALAHMSQCEQLIRWLYPVYEGDGNARYIASPPLMAIRWNNFIRGMKSESDLLMGIISSFTFNPIMEEGMFQVAQNFKGLERGNFLPKALEISLEFKPLHRGLMGNKKGSGRNQWNANDKFPYGSPRGAEIQTNAGYGSTRGSTNDKLGGTKLTKQSLTQVYEAPARTADHPDATSDTVATAAALNMLGGPK